MKQWLLVFLFISTNLFPGFLELANVTSQRIWVQYVLSEKTCFGAELRDKEDYMDSTKGLSLGGADVDVTDVRFALDYEKSHNEWRNLEIVSYSSTDKVGSTGFRYRAFHIMSGDCGMRVYLMRDVELPVGWCPIL